MTVRILVALVIGALLLSTVELSCIADEIAAPGVRSDMHVDAAQPELPPMLEDVEASATPILTR